MTRVKRGYIARRRRKKNSLFGSTGRGAHSKLTRPIAQHTIKALVSAHRDRNRKKSDFRRLWITRINAGIRANRAYSNYSKFLHDLHKRQSLLNRKILAEMAIKRNSIFYMISNEMRS